MKVNLPELKVDGAYKERVRGAAETDLFFFLNDILQVTSWWHPDVHMPFCDWLMEPNVVKDGCGFRGCLKTTGISGYMVWESIRDPEIAILLDSKVDKNSASTIRLIKNYWMKGERLRALYPELVPNFNDRSVKSSDFATMINRPSERRDPTYAAAGLGTTITTQHYNIIICDDLISAEKDKLTGEEAMPSVELIEQAIGTWRMFHTLLVDSAQGKMPKRVNVGTRWAINDLSAWIRQNEKNVATWDLPIEKDGVPTFPVKGDGSRGWDKERIEEKRSGMGSFMYEGQYLLNPLPKENMVFHPEWIKDTFFNLPDIVDMPMHYLVCLDPAFSKRITADYTGIVVVGISENDHRWVCEAEQVRIEDPFEMGMKAIRYANKYHGLPGAHRVQVVVETNAAQKILKPVFKKKMEETGTRFVIRDYQARGDKAQRIFGLAPFAEFGKLHIRRGLTAFEHQYSTWIPYKTKHEHLLDAAAQHIAFASKPSPKTARALHPSKLNPFDFERIRWENRQEVYKTMAGVQAFDRPWRPADEEVYV